MAVGGVECGPNAVLAFAREGYHLGDVNVRDLVESLTYPGFLRMAARNWKQGLGEMWRSISKAAFVRSLQRLVPEIRSEHLHPSPAGVRRRPSPATAVSSTTSPSRCTITWSTCSTPPPPPPPPRSTSAA